MASSTVIVESILVKLNASEALVDDWGFAVCCKNVMMSETSVREDWEMLHCKKEHSYMWAYIQSR
jgi:hypothetical protein